MMSENLPNILQSLPQECVCVCFDLLEGGGGGMFCIYTVLYMEVGTVVRVCFRWNLQIFVFVFHRLVGSQKNVMVNSFILG